MWSRRVRRLRGRMSVRWAVHLLVADTSVNLVDRVELVGDEGHQGGGLVVRALRFENQRRHFLRLAKECLVRLEHSTICGHNLIQSALDNRELRGVAQSEHSHAKVDVEANSCGAGCRADRKLGRGGESARGGRHREEGQHLRWFCGHSALSTPWLLPKGDAISTPDARRLDSGAPRGACRCVGATVKV